MTLRAYTGCHKYVPFGSGHIGRYRQPGENPKPPLSERYFDKRSKKGIPYIIDSEITLSEFIL
jgi:hypothetical protein